jgi:hypothetical protein
MDSSKTLSTKERSFVVTSLVLGCLLLSSAVLSSSGRLRQQEINVPIVKDNSRSFNLISQERIDRRFVTRMQNSSNKAITAYVTAVCGVPESAIDYAIGDDLIKPGGVVDIVTPVGTVSDMCRSTQPTITILAVVFDDKTSQGEFRWAKGVLDQRRGNKIQLRRINKLLTKALKWPDVRNATAIERLKEQIASLPVDEMEVSAVRGGLSDAKQRALYLLDELNRWHESDLTSQSRQSIAIQGELAGIDSLPSGIARLVTINEKWISRY